MGTQPTWLPFSHQNFLESTYPPWTHSLKYKFNVHHAFLAEFFFFQSNYLVSCFFLSPLDWKSKPGILIRNKFFPITIWPNQEAAYKIRILLVHFKFSLYYLRPFSPLCACSSNPEKKNVHNWYKTTEWPT